MEEQCIDIAFPLLKRGGPLHSAVIDCANSESFSGRVLQQDVAFHVVPVPDFNDYLSLLGKNSGLDAIQSLGFTVTAG